MSEKSRKPAHRLSKRSRYIGWGVAGVAVAATGGLIAQSASAAPAWPAQKTFTGLAFDT
ncbi:peptidoglycan-binding protein, partial [Streptomyces sp. NPDC056085]